MSSETWTADEVRRQVARIRASSGFARNDRMSRFLAFLVERTLEGHSDDLKESVIGVEVFHRRPGYDPRADSIVRTEAGRLRSRLADYYAGEGEADELVIGIPKGSYVPLLHRREHPAVAGAASRPQPWIVAIALVGLLAALAGGTWAFHRASPIRIAVLPLENLTPGAEGESLADGLTEEIINNISVIDGLEVRSRTSSFVFKEQRGNVRDIARQLDVDYVLEGSVLHEGEHLRIDAQLIRASADAPVWSGRFDRKLKDVFAIQDEISLGIVNNLRLRLGRGRRRYETSVDAYMHYLRGSASLQPHVVSDRPLRPEEMPAARQRNSIRAFQDAIASDRAFAPAYAGLASVYAVASVQFPLDHPADELPAMRAAAEKAVELDPLLPEAHHALALVQARDGHWAEAEQSFRRALELDPNGSATRLDYAYWLLAVLGRHDEALSQLRAAARADPLSPDVRFTTALILVAAGRYTEAAEYCARLPSPMLCLSRVRTGEGRFDETIRLLEHHQELEHNPQTRGFLAFAYARAGRSDAAEQMAAVSRFPNEQALAFAGLKDKDRALDALTRMNVLGAQRVGLYLHYPEFAFLRDDPRLTDFRARTGLP